MAERKVSQAKRALEGSLAIREKLSQPETPEVATTLNILGAIYYRQREYALAEPLYRRALAIDEKLLGPQHSDVARDLNNLATLFLRTGRHEEAESFYKRAVAIGESSTDLEPVNAQILFNLGDLYRSDERFEEAAVCYKQAADHWGKVLTPTEFAAKLELIAKAHRAMAMYVQAEKFRLKAAKIPTEEREVKGFSGGR